MSKPKLLIIVLFQNLGEKKAYYAQSPAPPLAGALIAGLTPPLVEVELLHEIDPSSILLSISIPIPGTPFFKKVKSERRILDENLAHYEGDHLVFKPMGVNSDQIFEASRVINKYFYSWKNIAKRWWRVITSMSYKDKILERVFHMMLISSILIKLSLFQKDHAEKKVYGFTSN